ncbi:hypothetical protein Ciccas_008812, partial [Cichlidogyrus casuarinus]
IMPEMVKQWHQSYKFATRPALKSVFNEIYDQLGEEFFHVFKNLSDEKSCRDVRRCIFEL